MIPQTELDRALARWKSRKLGLSDAPTPIPVSTGYSQPVTVHDEATVVRDYVDAVAGAELDAGSSSGVISLGEGDYDEQG